MNNNKKALIFVGGFGNNKNVSQPGGQVTSSRMLLKSNLSNVYKFYLIDSIARIHPPESLALKFFKSAKRIVKLVCYCLYKRPVAILLFGAYGLSFFEKGFMCLIARVFRIKSLLSIRSGHFLTEVQHSKIQRIYKTLLLIPNKLICQSRSWIDFYTSLGIPSENCVTIPNMIDPDKYISCRTEQPLDNCINFLYVGTFALEKGVMDLLAAINLIHKKLPLARWLIIGGGPAENIARDYVKRKGLQAQVEITGWLSSQKLSEYYTKANIFVLPSHAEGFPNVLLEAMSAGLPVITTAVGGIPGILRDGVHGLFVQQPGDPNELAKQMLVLANDYNQRKKYSIAVIEHATNHHHIEKNWDKFVFAIDGNSNFDTLQKQSAN
jgi:glycosyltransferase involved in cell wall biosynthesis